MKKRNPLAAISWLLILILGASCVRGVSAKYVQQRQQDVLVQAKLFYFTSDLLKEEGAEYTLNADTTKVTFKLHNFADDHRVSEVDLQYTVTVDGNQLGQEALMTAGKKTDTISFNVEDGNSYTVSVKAASSYEKTLSATFHVAPKQEGFYKHLSSTDYYVLLTVWTENFSGNMTVNFPAGLIPDDTDPNLAGINNYSDETYTGGTTPSVALGERSSVTYRFFKENPESSYSLNDFPVTMGDKTAIAGTP